MPNQFFSPEGDLEEYFATDYWLFEQYIGNQLWTWGDNYAAQLGVNDMDDRRTPVQEFTSSTNWKQVAGGNNHAVAIKTDGTLWTWGDNFDAQLGVNDRVDRSTPVQEFTSSTNWKQVSGGGDHTAAIKTDGTLWTWGDNGQGQLGVNDNIRRSTPAQEFSSSTNWKQVAGGNQHTLAIKTDGTLWGWGNNTTGQLGINSPLTYRSTPVQEFTSSTNWKQVDCNIQHSAAIKTDGTLWVWGYNLGGRLGLINITYASVPTQDFSSSANWKQVSCGNDYTAAIKTDGTLWLWGRNNYAQLGLNDRVDRSTLVQDFTSSTTWKQVACGNDSSGAIKTDGTLWTWGRNLQGEIGDNTTAARSTPRQEFTSSTNWKQVDAHNDVTWAVKTGIEIDTGTLT